MSWVCVCGNDELQESYWTIDEQGIESFQVDGSTLDETHVCTRCGYSFTEAELLAVSPRAPTSNDSALPRRLMPP